MTMKTELAIYRQAGAVFCVLLEDGEPVELLQDRSPGQPRRQDIFLGQVRQVVPALGCAFVDIGSPHDALLPLREAGSGCKPGQRLIVQVKREENPGKGHQLTTRVQIPGPFAVYSPGSPTRRRSKLQSFTPEDQRLLFEQDLRQLEKTWQDLLAAAESGPAPRLLHPAGDPLYRALTSLVSGSTERIRVEGEDLFQTADSLIRQFMPAYLPLLSLFVNNHGFGLAAALQIEDLPDRLKARKIWFSSGGFIIVDPSEALTAIDVNSGKDIRGKTTADLRLRTNLEAAEAIARCLRLRNIGGIIIIDFLNMPGPDDREVLLAAFQEALSSDRGRNRIGGFTALGLLEMTRTRV